MIARALLASLLFVAPAFATQPGGLPSTLPPAVSADQRRAVLELMKQNTEKYGADAALLQGLLLIHSLQGEAVFTTESTILGFEQAQGRRYVAFHLASGVVLDDKHLSREQRLERIWHVVLERTLLKYPKFQCPAEGVVVEIQYNHRPYDHAADLATSDDAGPAERAKFYILESDLTEFLEHRLGAQQFLERSRILLDDQPVKLTLTEVTMPPRPPRDAPAQTSLRAH